MSRNPLVSRFAMSSAALARMRAIKVNELPASSGIAQWLPADWSRLSADKERVVTPEQADQLRRP